MHTWFDAQLDQKILDGILAIAIRVILSWLDNDVKWEHFQLNGELWECGICTLLVLSKNKINFETPLKNTTPSVNDLKVPEKPKLKCEGFTYNGAKLFNMLPPKTREIKDPNTFKTEMKNWIWENIPSY